MASIGAASRRACINKKNSLLIVKDIRHFHPWLDSFESSLLRNPHWLFSRAKNISSPSHAHNHAWYSGIRAALLFLWCFLLYLKLYQCQRSCNTQVLADLQPAFADGHWHLWGLGSTSSRKYLLLYCQKGTKSLRYPLPKMPTFFLRVFSLLYWRQALEYNRVSLRFSAKNPWDFWLNKCYIWTWNTNQS